MVEMRHAFYLRANIVDKTSWRIWSTQSVWTVGSAVGGEAVAYTPISGSWLWWVSKANLAFHRYSPVELALDLVRRLSATASRVCQTCIQLLPRCPVEVMADPKQELNKTALSYLSSILCLAYAMDCGDQKRNMAVTFSDHGGANSPTREELGGGGGWGPKVH